MFCMLPKTEEKKSATTLLYHMEEWILRGLLLVLLFCYFVSRESWLRSNSALYLHLSPFLLLLRVRVQLSARVDTCLGWDAWGFRLGCVASSCNLFSTSKVINNSPLVHVFLLRILDILTPLLLLLWVAFKRCCREHENSIFFVPWINGIGARFFPAHISIVVSSSLEVRAQCKRRWGHNMYGKSEAINNAPKKR